MGIISIAAKTFGVKHTTFKKVRYVKKIVMEWGEEQERDAIEIDSAPWKRYQCICPECGNKCPGYDRHSDKPSHYRGPSVNGVPIELVYTPRRIKCPKHGVPAEMLPWKDGNTRSLACFNDEVAFLALTSPKSVVSQFFGINWRTVGNCIKAAHDRLEPDLKKRFDGLVRICVDETSYRKGHRYITVVYDMDRNRVVWLHEGYGDTIFELFCKELSEEQRKGIQVVAGDSAGWITRMTEKYFPNATRCVDFFHVVQWVNEALDKVRACARAKAQKELERTTEELGKAEKEMRESVSRALKELEDAKRELEAMPSRGRPSKRKRELAATIAALEEQLAKCAGDAFAEISPEEYEAAKKEFAEMPSRGRWSARKKELAAIIARYEKNSAGTSVEGLGTKAQTLLEELGKKADALKGAKHVLGMGYENLSKSAKEKLGLIEASLPDVYAVYRLKETLRVILHMTDASLAATELEKWIGEARECGFQAFEKVAEKVGNNSRGILSAIRMQANSAKSEATNTTIKALVKTARGFRNMDNMFALIYLRCSDIAIPLNNRRVPSPEKLRDLREIASKRKADREAQKRCELNETLFAEGN